MLPKNFMSKKTFGKKKKRINGGTVPTFKMHPRGTVPPFKMHPGGTLDFYDVFFYLDFGMCS